MTVATYSKPVIDLHFHWYPEEFIALMESEAGNHGADVQRDAAGRITIKTPTSTGRDGGNALRRDESKTDIDLMIAEMNEADIDLEVVTQTNPHIIWAPPAFGARLARSVNDGNSRLHQLHPDRFIGTITLPMQDVALSLEELERAHKLPGMRAVNVTEQVRGKNIGDPSFWPIWDRCEALGLPLFLKNVDTVSERLDDPGASQMNIISNPFEATIAATSLMLSGTLDEFPSLEVLLPHGGGFFPFVTPRIDFAMKSMSGNRFKNMKLDSASSYLRRFHYDLILHSPSLTRTLIDLVGIDRVACGTDRPQGMNIANPVEYVEAIPGISAAEAEAILCGNPARLLKL